MSLRERRLEVALCLKAILNKKMQRKEVYLRKQEELVKRCRTCIGASKGAWYCEDCTIGLRLHYLDAEYSDVNNWWKVQKPTTTKKEGTS